jgi:hypothetical protein
MKDSLRADQISPFLIDLLDPRSETSGEVVECGGGWGAELRWQRAAGGEPGAIAFDRQFDLPSSTADSLGAALGDPRTMYRMA